MEIIKNDSNFFVNESRQPKGYIPLSARKNISLVAAFLGSESVEVALAQNVR